MTTDLSLAGRISADVSLYSVVAIGWLGLIQPWLTAIATILAILWTAIQVRDFYQKNKKKRKRKP